MGMDGLCADARRIPSGAADANFSLYIERMELVRRAVALRIGFEWPASFSKKCEKRMRLGDAGRRKEADRNV